MFIGIYVQQISGERLQDHWSSGSNFHSKHQFLQLKELLLIVALLKFVNTNRIHVSHDVWPYFLKTGRYSLMAGGTDASDPWGMREEPQEIQGLGNMEIRQQQQHILRGE